MSNLRNSKIQGLWACACEVEIAQFEGTQNKEQTQNQTKIPNSEIAKTGLCRDSRVLISTSHVFKSTSGKLRPAVVVAAGRQKASIESPLIPTQPSSGPWDLVRGLVETIYARLSCRGCAYMAVEWHLPPRGVPLGSGARSRISATSSSVRP